MNSGVKMNISESEPNRTPSPKRNMNMPSNMGFLTQAYSPVVMSFGGGVKGTGVPRVWKNDMTGQNMMRQPAIISSQPRPKLHHVEPKSRQVSHLSSHKEAKMKRTMMPKNISAATGVVTILPLLPPVATL